VYVINGFVEIILEAERKRNETYAQYFLSLFVNFSSRRILFQFFPLPTTKESMTGNQWLRPRTTRPTLSCRQCTVTALIITFVSQLLDINECVPASDCMHKCKNFDGGYNCSCDDFFKVDPVNSKNCIRTYILI